MKNDNESNQPQRIFLKDYTAPSFSVEGVELHFDLHETATRVRCRQSIKQVQKAPLVLNGENLKLLSIKLDGRPLTANEYEIRDSELIVNNVGAQFVLETEVQINPEANKSCTGLYLSRGIFATQCEAEGFRHITYFMDRPDVMTNYKVTMVADKTKFPVLLSNGDLISKRDLSDGRHEAVWSDPFKKPCYLFALVGGDLGVVQGTYTTASGKKIKLEVFASHGKQNRCHHALESLIKAMKWDEERFGLEYDLNQYMIVSIDDFNMGAMENKGLNIFNSRLVLADPESATDQDFDRIESVVGHEYFHNWTGNRVTCRNWFELSLKEGLTVFRDQEFSSDLNSRAVQRIKDVDALRGSQFAEDAGPNSHPVRPESCLAVDNFYTATIYEKGSEVIRMIQTMVGRTGFRKGMDEYFRRHDGQAVTILDFVDAIAAPNQADFSQFKLWYSQSGTPEVSITENFNAAKREYSLTLSQSCPLTEKQPVKQPFHIPLLIGLIDRKGNEIQLKSPDVRFNSDEKAVIHLKQVSQTFTFSDIAEKPILSINREFSAPIKLKWAAGDDELLHLIKYDSDSFNRREAIYKMVLEELVRLVREQGQPKLSVLHALGFVLEDEKIDPQFKALMLQLPDEDVIAQNLDVVDGRAMQAAQIALLSALVRTYDKQMAKLYETHHRGTTAGDRALKNRILRYFSLAEHPTAVSLAFNQFENAQNMTDKLGALVALSLGRSAQKTSALSAFYERWKDDAVVFNKWIQVQALAPLDETYQTVKTIYRDAAFSQDNPNNIYSLHGSFGHNYFSIQTAGAPAFNWLCDEIIRIDKVNPQAAARVCSSFNFVKKYPAELKSAAQKEISRVLSVKDLSKNSRELLEGCIEPN